MESGVLFIFYLISFVIGTSVLGLCMLLYIENRSAVLKYFLMILVTEFINDIFNIMLLYYKTETKIYFSVTAAAASFFQFLILGFLIAEVAGFKLKKIEVGVIGGVLLGASLSIIAERAVGDSFLFKSINVLFYAVIGYYIYMIVKGYKREKNKEVRLILTIILVAFIFAIPFALIREIFFNKIQYLNHIEDSVIYLMINVGGVILFFRKMSLKMEIKKETENNERVNENSGIEKNTEYNRVEKQAIEEFVLTQREKEITELIMDGLTNQEIADKLFISIKTVKTHIYNIYQKLDIKNRTELIFKFKKQ